MIWLVILCTATFISIHEMPSKDSAPEIFSDPPDKAPKLETWPSSKLCAIGFIGLGILFLKFFYFRGSDPINVPIQICLTIGFLVLVSIFLILLCMEMDNDDSIIESVKISEI